MPKPNTAIEICQQYTLGVRKFHQAQLENAVLEKACLSQIDFKQSNLNHVNFERADLSHSDFREASLIKANLSRANLSYADFSNTNLSHANLTGANLYKANFCSANLSRANLSIIKFVSRKTVTPSQELASVNLVNSTKVNFRCANLKRAFFIGVDLSNANLDKAIYDDQTNISPDFDPTSKGMVHISMMQEIAINGLLSKFNHIYSYSYKYLGKTLSARYFDSSRPEFKWLNQFKISKSNKIHFVGIVPSFINPEQLELFQQWIESFTKSCSLIIKDFKELI